MAILITGGTGFIGSHLIPFLKKEGYEIILFIGDILKEKDIQNFKTTSKIEAIIHLAAAVNNKDKNVFWKVNVEGTKNIVDLGRRLQVGRLIFLSSIRVLSNSGDPYIDSKKGAGKVVINSELPYIILRPSMVYGPGDKKNIGFLLKCAKIMPVMPVFNFRMQPLFVGDLARAIEASLRYSTNTILNIVGPEILSFKEILQIIRKQSRKNFLLVNYPRFFNWLLLAFACLPFFPLPRWQVKTLLADEIYQGDDWQKLLGIEAISFAGWLRKTLI